MEQEKFEILEDTLGRFYKTGTETLFRCPRCRHDKRKMSINVEKGVYKCWVCDYAGSNISKLIRRYGTREQYCAWQDLTKTVEISKFEDLFSKKELVEEKSKVFLPKDFKSLINHDNSAAARHAKKYLKSRGVSDVDILRWKIGYCEKGDYYKRICIPSFDQNGDLNYFVARSYDDHFPRYKNPPASRDIVFNDLYLDWSKPIILVEGVFDAIVAGNAVPILGSSLKEDSKLLKKIIKEGAAVYVALDPDAKSKENRIIKTLTEYDIETYKIQIAPYSDVGEMTKDEFSNRMKEAAVMNSSDYLYQYLNF